MTTKTTTPADAPAATPKGRTRTTSPKGKPATPHVGLTAADLQNESYTAADLRKMASTSKNADTVKLATAELERRAALAQTTARAKNTVAVAPAVAEAAQAAVAAQASAEQASRDAVLAYLQQNPSASAPQTQKATGVSYSRVRKFAEAAGHRFQAQDRTAAAKITLTPEQITAIRLCESTTELTIETIARALRNPENRAALDA